MLDLAHFTLKSLEAVLYAAVFGATIFGFGFIIRETFACLKWLARG